MMLGKQSHTGAHMNNFTDIKVDENVFTTVQINTYMKGNLGIFRKVVAAAKKAIEAPLRDKLTEAGNDVRIVYYLKNLKTRRTHGKCIRSANGKVITVLLNAKVLPGFKDMAETLGHEMVHVEQYMTGRMTSDGYHRVWEGQKHDGRGTTYESYRNLPWEKEAFDRQAEEASKILNAYHKG